MAVGISTRYSVRCDKHGQKHSAIGEEKVVFVPVPKNKRDKKFRGCPFCKKELNN